MNLLNVSPPVMKQCSTSKFVDRFLITSSSVHCGLEKNDKYFLTKEDWQECLEVYTYKNVKKEPLSKILEAKRCCNTTLLVWKCNASCIYEVSEATFYMSLCERSV